MLLSGNVYIAELYNGLIRKVTILTGNITTIAGGGTDNQNLDGGQATSIMLNEPYGISVDFSGGAAFSFSFVSLF